MRTLFYISCVMMASSACQRASDGATVANANLSTAHFSVEGMTCGSCDVAVKMAAEKVTGVADAGASHAEHTAWARFDPNQTTPASIAEAITEAGYAASVRQPARQRVASHQGTGVIKEIDADRRSVRIDHKAIAGFMPAMVMTFNVADPKLLAGLEPEDTVAFTLAVQGGHATVTAVTPAP